MKTRSMRNTYHEIRSQVQRGGKSQCPGWAVMSGTDRAGMGLRQEVSEQHPPSRSPGPPLCHPTLPFSAWFPSQHSCLPDSFPPFLSSSLPSFSCWLYVFPTRRQILWEQDAVPTVVPGMQLVFNKCVRAGGQGRHSGNQVSRQGEREAAGKIPSTETDSCPYSPLPSILLLLRDLSYYFSQITSERFALMPQLTQFLTWP